MTTRRDLLTGGVAIVTAPLLAVGAQADSINDAAIFALAERRRSLDAAATDAGRIGDNPSPAVREASEARVDELADAMTEIEDEIADMSADTTAGVAVKLRMAFETLMPNENYSGGRLARSALADLERLASA